MLKKFTIYNIKNVKKKFTIYNIKMLKSLLYTMLKMFKKKLFFLPQLEFLF